ncbi:putative glycerophosphodiester phosphodiesterase, protein kinase RLK-Pelle-LRK10L-2 family [Rosa chinensis]|uniref:Putative glycerophosphodiester phosphodiesterase, protein kinase RLK-Pelle-LRK10L-2 family n=1 Tax=Rosa chinensis TaxID=74649 RepID=A0A2P6QHC8_ROSCH|nr:putative glycerophosphodiester phosphodiesterase, protein kinase RLK-Pelle-LRK10L-2 family [Rosa chinensis]
MTALFLFFVQLQDKAVKAFLRNYGPLQVRKYSYSDVTKMTNSFKTKLGQGGYGSVYKGKLPDGNLVAVKVLNKLKALDRISLGIARGLEYLHRGCNTRILHFDIKPHNILLDANFSPKISDFGLAKICDRAGSVVSMLGARGTAGYIAPEVFCRNFGGVSHKSDVYSFGMMLSEMVGGRRNINVEADNTSEIYFPHWIYKRLELDELGIQSVTNAEDKVRARKMIIVSLWCIQTNPSNRAGMKEVIEMLEGSVESLQIPPKPYLSSPLKSAIVTYSSTTLVSI